MIINERELMRIVEKTRAEGKTIITTNGAFDLFHYGHLKTLRFAKEQGDVLFVCINSDSSIKECKSKKRPIIPEMERAEIVSAIKYVDYVIIFSEKTPERILSLIKPDVHVKGSEYKGNIIEKDIVEKHGGKMMFVDRDKTSTTKIIEKIIDVYTR